MRPSNRTLWISKGPGPDRCVAMDLPDHDQAAAMLKSLGFSTSKKIEKQRDIYFIGDYHVTLDTVPNLGTFVELAIMTDDEAALPKHREGVAAMAERIDLLACVEEEKSYREMLLG
jgi:adenylate cyclase class 2